MQSQNEKFNDGGSAFPRSGAASQEPPGYLGSQRIADAMEGLTKLEVYSVVSLHALLSNPLQCNALVEEAQKKFMNPMRWIAEVARKQGAHLLEVMAGTEDPENREAAPRK